MLNATPGTEVADSEPARIQFAASSSGTSPATSPCPPPRRTMPVTYGRPRPPPTHPISHPTPPSPTFTQNWKQHLEDIDSGVYTGQIISESSELTPLPSSLAPGPQQAVLPRSTPPSSPTRAYREPDNLTDDLDTSLELNTTLTALSSDPEEPVDHKDNGSDDDDSDSQPIVRRRTKPLLILNSGSDEDDLGLVKPVNRRRLLVESGEPLVSPSNDISQLSLDQSDLPSAPTSGTTTSSTTKSPAAASKDESDNDGSQPVLDEKNGDLVEESRKRPKDSRSMRTKGLSKAEKGEMAKAQQEILNHREVRVPDTSKRIDPKNLFSSYSASIRQAEIDSYPFPPGPRSRTFMSQPTATSNPNDKDAIRRKIEMLPLSAHTAPRFGLPSRAIVPQSDPIIESSPLQGPSNANATKSGEMKQTGIGSRNALGALMFGAPQSSGRPSGGDVFGPDNSDDELPPTSALFTRDQKPAGDTTQKRALAEKKSAALAVQRSVSDSDSSDSGLEVEAVPQNKGKGKATRILARPGQDIPVTQKRAQKGLTETQVERAGHAHHFGGDAEQIGSSPVRGGGVYEESQFGRALLPGSKPSGSTRPAITPRKSTAAKNSVPLPQLTKFVAKRALEDGQARQRADEDRWRASGGKERAPREVLNVGDAVQLALDGSAGGGNESEDSEDDEDTEYRGSASESEVGEDKENLPASGRARQPHEPVSDFDGSGVDEADADKENSLELVGMNGQSPATLGARSPIPPGGQSPAQLMGSTGIQPSPSRFNSHSRVSSLGSTRIPLSQLEDEGSGDSKTENAAVARSPLGELDVETKAEAEDEEEELPRRPRKRTKQDLSRKLFDLDDDVEDSLSELRSPSRRLKSPSHRFGSPTPRLGIRFSTPPSRLRSPILADGTQHFKQTETQGTLGGLADVFGFESQAPPAGDAGGVGAGDDGGLTQLFANAEAGKSSAFAALRSDANNIELTQDERSKLLYRPVLGEDELRRDQEIFEREDALMAQPFSPTQRNKETQEWLNEWGLWTQTRPVRVHSDPTDAALHPSRKELPSPLDSPMGSEAGPRRIIRKGAIESEHQPSAKMPSALDLLMDGSRNLGAKDKNKAKRLGKSEFVEGEAAESDDEYGDFGPRIREEDEDGDEDDEHHVEGLVDDAAMDDQTENAADVQAKYLEQNAEDDARNERAVRDVVAGKHRSRRRGRGDNMNLDDESEDDGYEGPTKLLKKRKIENDGLDGLEKHKSTKPFVDAYNKANQPIDSDTFSHLNQITDTSLGGAHDSGDEDEPESGQQDEGGVEQTTTPFRTAQMAVPSSTKAVVAFGLHDDLDDGPMLDLPDAIPRSLASAGHKLSMNSTRLKTWAEHEGGNVRASLRGGQGVTVTGHGKSKTTKNKPSSLARAEAPGTSSSSSNKLSRLRSKAEGFM